MVSLSYFALIAAVVLAYLAGMCLGWIMHGERDRLHDRKEQRYLGGYMEDDDGK